MATMTARTATRTAIETTQPRRPDTSREMSVMGVGVEIAIPALIYTLVAQLLSRLFSPLFRITGNRRSLRVLRTTGTWMAIAGFSLNLVAAVAMLKAHREERLATGGLYRLFRDPMYVLQIFITLPGLFLLFNSWLVLTGVVPAYVAYRIFVRDEHRYLEERFGQAYREYLEKVLFKM